MTPTINVANTPVVANGPKQGPGDPQGIIAPGKTTGYQRSTDGLPGAKPGAKQGYATQYHFQNFHQQINTMAKSIRTDDSTLENIQSLLNKAERPLLNIAKTYPPFPFGSEERVEMLKSFNSYRKMINKLTIPPVEDDFLQNMSFQPKSSTEDLRLPGNDLNPKQIPAPGEMSIPGLSKNATDKEIDAVLGQIGDVKTTLLDKRERLFAKAARIKQMLHQDHPYKESILAKLGSGGLGDDSKPDVEGLSRNVKKGLLAESAGYMHANHSQMIGLL